MSAAPVPRPPAPAAQGTTGQQPAPALPDVQQIIAGLPDPVPDGQELDDQALDRQIAQVTAVAERLQQRLSDVSR